MRQELADRLLRAAQDVVGDGEVRLVDIGHRDPAYVVDSDVFEGLKAVVAEISHEAVRELTEGLRQSNGQYIIQEIGREMEDLYTAHHALLLQEETQPLTSWPYPGHRALEFCVCDMAGRYRLTRAKRDELRAGLKTRGEAIGANDQG